jgi:hypothetical protein
VRESLESNQEPLVTTIPVLTEAFHMLGPASVGSDGLRDFIEHGGLSAWFLDRAALRRAFELMEQYADHPMDLVDASLVAAQKPSVRGGCSRSTERTSRRIEYAAGTAIRRCRSCRDQHERTRGCGEHPPMAPG